MQQKCDAVKKYYSGETSESKVYEFDYSQRFDALTRFSGTHPEVMRQRIEAKNWEINIDTKKIRMKFKYRLLYYFEKWFGIRLFEYRNYHLNSKSFD